MTVSTAEQPAPAKASGWTSRRIVTDGLLTITTVLLIVGVFAVWANRQLLNPSNWGSTSTSLLQNQQIRDATANYLVDQLYANVDVSSLLSQRLPPALQPLAGPAAGALRNAAVQGTELALSRPVVQGLWSKANRAADQALVAIINGGNKQVSVKNGAVTLNLGAILNDVASQLGITANLGAKLPPSVANLVIIRANQLSLIQDIGGALKGLATVLYILVPLLYIAAMVIARDRRRKTLMAIGWSGIVAGLVVLLARSLTVKAAASTLTNDDSVRPAVRAVASIATGTLTDVATAVILVAAVLVVAAWFAGPSRFAVPPRRWLAPYLEANPVATYGVVVAILLLIFIWQPIPATGTPVGMIVFTVLALIGTEVLRREARVEFGTAPATTPGTAEPVAAGAPVAVSPAGGPVPPPEPPPAPEATAADPEPAPREPSAP
jgi:hypothetical protein